MVTILYIHGYFFSFLSRTPSNMFVVNLAVSDCIMMTTMGPPVTINAFTKVKNKGLFQKEIAFQITRVESSQAKLKVCNFVLSFEWTKERQKGGSWDFSVHFLPPTGRKSVCCNCCLCRAGQLTVFCESDIRLRN